MKKTTIKGGVTVDGIQDALNNWIQKGYYIAFASKEGALRLGKVLEVKIHMKYPKQSVRVAGLAYGGYGYDDEGKFVREGPERWWWQGREVVLKGG